MSTYLDVFRATVLALAEEIQNLRGFRITRLKQAHSAGDTTLYVESAYGFPTSGVLIIQGESDPVTYTGTQVAYGDHRFTGCSALENDHRPLDQVVNWTRTESKMDMLRRALLIEYAEERDLDRVTRLECNRPRGFSDDDYRTLAKVISYLPRCRVYAFELVLDALYPGGGYTIYESLAEHPGVIFIEIPPAIGDSEEGRAFMNAIDEKDSDTATQVTLSDTPTSVESIWVQNVEETMAMTVLPSADTPAWTYVAESSGTEGTYFSISSERLLHTHPSGTNSGKYRLSVPELGLDYNSIEVWWRPGTLTTVAGYPWKLIIEDGEREYALVWDADEVALAQADETLRTSKVTFATGDHWTNFKLVRDGDYVIGYVNHVQVLKEPVSSFSASSNNRFEFGYTDNGNSNNWTCYWDNVRWFVRNRKNYWNLERSDGVLTAVDANLTSAANKFLSGDTGKLCFLYATEDENYGLWRGTYSSGTVLTLDGVERTDGYASTLANDFDADEARFYSTNPRFIPRDVGKTLNIVESDVGNDDTYPIVGYVSPNEIVVDISGHSAGLITEETIKWKFDPDFVAESSIPWELVDAGSAAAAVLTLRDSLPQATQPVTAHYTTVESAQTLLNEVEVNAGSGARYPFYLSGVAERIQRILEDVSAAGVIVRYHRNW
jgi:hypothetical protein